MLTENLTEIVIFVAVVDAGSFVKGAQSMGLTRSAASKAMVRLEDRLGTRLLHRTTRALSLTAEGHVFYERAVAVLTAVQDAEVSVAKDTGTPRGILRLTAPDTFGRRVILPLLSRYLAAWPSLQAEVSFSDQPVEIVQDGFDLAIRIDATSADSRLVKRVLVRYERVLVASPAYLLVRGEPASVEGLNSHDRLLFASRSGRQSWRLRDLEGTWTTTLGRSRLRLDNGEALREAAVSGLGIALLPLFLVGEDLDARRLRRVLPGVVASEVEIVAIYPSRRLLEPRVRRFIDMMMEELS